ncbi:MAG: winged helix-turn-helix transcriptional regulator [Phycicoccus sp.]|nr:winged helix-turn-helix transcriptional regulator [Phycicoccus sp.]
MHANMQEPEWDEDVITLAVEVLRMLADPTRLRIAGALLDEERSVSELAALLERPVPGVSQHLAKMRLARLVATRKQGNSVLYRIEDDHVRQLVLDTIGHVEHLLDKVPAHHRASAALP